MADLSFTKTRRFDKIQIPGSKPYRTVPCRPTTHRIPLENPYSPLSRSSHLPQSPSDQARAYTPHHRSSLSQGTTLRREKARRCPTAAGERLRGAVLGALARLPYPAGHTTVTRFPLHHVPLDHAHLGHVSLAPVAETAPALVASYLAVGFVGSGEGGRAGREFKGKEEEETEIVGGMHLLGGCRMSGFAPWA